MLDWLSPLLQFRRQIRFLPPLQFLWQTGFRMVYFCVSLWLFLLVHQFWCQKWDDRFRVEVSSLFGPSFDPVEFRINSCCVEYFVLLFLLMLFESFWLVWIYSILPASFLTASRGGVIAMESKYHIVTSCMFLFWSAYFWLCSQSSRRMVHCRLTRTCGDPTDCC